MKMNSRIFLTPRRVFSSLERISSPSKVCIIKVKVSNSSSLIRSNLFRCCLLPNTFQTLSFNRKYTDKALDHPSDIEIGVEKTLEISSTLDTDIEKKPENSKVKEIYEGVLKLCRETKDEKPEILEKTKDMLKNIRPTLGKVKKRFARSEQLIQSLPENADATQIYNAFVEAVEGERSSLFIYSELIQMFGMSGNYERAQEFFDLMVANGVTPDVWSRTSLMNAYSNGGDLQTTLEIFEQCHKDPNNLSPFPYSILIKTYMKHRRVQDAFNVVELMKQKMAPITEIFNSLIQGCAKIKDFSRAWVAYDMMLKHDCQPDMVTYSNLISICQRDEVQKALDLFDELLKRGLSPSARCVNSLLAALSSQACFYPTMIELFNTLTAKNLIRPTPYSFALLTKGAAQSQNIADARRFFLLLQRSQCEPKDLLSSFSSLFEAYSVIFPTKRIMRTADPITSGNSTFAFLEAPPPTCIEDCVQEALKLLPFLKKIDRKTDSIHDGNRPWMNFMSILTTYNYFTDATRWFQFIESRFNGNLHPSTYKCMLEMCARLGKESEFLSVLVKAEALLAPARPDSTLTERQRLEYRYMKLLTPVRIEKLYQIIILGLTRFNRLDEALNYFKFLTKDSSINWKKKEDYYAPFFRAILGSSNLDLKAQLDQLKK